MALAVIKCRDKRLHAVDQASLRSAPNGDFAVMHPQAVVLAIGAHFLVQQEPDLRFLAA